MSKKDIGNKDIDFILSNFNNLSENEQQDLLEVNNMINNIDSDEIFTEDFRKKASVLFEKYGYNDYTGGTDREITIDMNEIFADGFKEIYDCKAKHRAIYGSRAGAKSLSIAIEAVIRIIKYPWSNYLILRQINETHASSTWANILWAISRLGVDDLFKINIKQREIIYKSTGQKIMFKGLDKPQALNSISVPTGKLTFVWFEEFSDVIEKEAFEQLNASIRGGAEYAEMYDDFFMQFTYSFNPWDSKHFSHDMFFGDINTQLDNLYVAKTSLYDNRFLTKDDVATYYYYLGHDLESTYLDGEWGNTEGKVFKSMEVRNINPDELKNADFYYGLDFGYNDPTAFSKVGLDLNTNTLYILDELYEPELVLHEVAEKLKHLGYNNVPIYADNANKQQYKSLARTYGFTMRKCVKGNIVDGVNFLKSFNIVISPNCKNAIREFNNYVYNNRNNSKPFLGEDHMIDATRYALSKYRTETFTQEEKRHIQKNHNKNIINILKGYL